MDDKTIKWRHFSEQATITIQNPFDYDFMWQVATPSVGGDVKNVYKIGAKKVGTVPGGIIGTLCVYNIVNELIQIDKKESMMWDARTRKEYEDKIILQLDEPEKQYENNQQYTDLSTTKAKKTDKKKAEVAVNFTNEEMLVEES